MSLRSAGLFKAKPVLKMGSPLFCNTIVLCIMLKNVKLMWPWDEPLLTCCPSFCQLLGGMVRLPVTVFSCNAAIYSWCQRAQLYCPVWLGFWKFAWQIQERIMCPYICFIKNKSHQLPLQLLLFSLRYVSLQWLCFDHISQIWSLPTIFSKRLSRWRHRVSSAVLY